MCCGCGFELSMCLRWLIGGDVGIVRPPEVCYLGCGECVFRWPVGVHTGHLKVFGWWIVMLFVRQINAASGGLFGSFFYRIRPPEACCRGMRGCWRMALWCGRGQAGAKGLQSAFLMALASERKCHDKNQQPV